MQQYASWCIEDGHQQKLRSLATDYPSMVQVFNTNIQIHALCSYVVCPLVHVFFACAPLSMSVAMGLHNFRKYNSVCVLDPKVEDQTCS